MAHPRDWADEAISNLKRVHAVSRPAGISQGKESEQSAANVDSRVLALALADYLRSDNPTTQAIAIRVKNLMDKYPQRAY